MSTVIFIIIISIYVSCICRALIDASEKSVTGNRLDDFFVTTLIAPWLFPVVGIWLYFLDFCRWIVRKNENR